MRAHARYVQCGTQPVTDRRYPHEDPPLDEYTITFMAQEQLRDRLAEAEARRHLRSARALTAPRRPTVGRPRFRAVRRWVGMGQPA